MSDSFKQKALLVLFFIGVFATTLLADYRPSHKASAAAATCYWVGDTNPASWNDATHWSNANGGAGSTCDGGVVPGSDDTVIFSSANTNGATFDATTTLSSLTLQSGYSGTITFNNDTSTLTTTDLTLTAGSISVAAQGTYRTKVRTTNLTINGGSYTHNNYGVLDVNGAFTMTSGSFVVGGISASVTIAGNFDFQGGTFTDTQSATNSGFTFDGNSATILNANNTFSTFFNNKTAGQTLTWQDDITTGTFRNIAGNLDTNSHTLTMNSVSGSLRPGNQSLDNVVIDANPVYLNDSGTIDGTFTINTGKILTNQSSSVLTFSDTGRLVLNGTGTLDSYYISPGTTVFTDDSATNLPTGGTLAGKIKILASTKNIILPVRNYVGRLELSSSSDSERTITLGAGTYNIGNHGRDDAMVGGLFVSANGAGNLIVDAATNDPTVNLLTGLATYTNGDIDYVGTGGGSEHLNAGDGTWTLKGDMDLTGGTFTANSSTFVFNGGSSQPQTLTSNGQSLNNLTIQNVNATGFTFADGATIAGILRDTTATSKVTFHAGSTYTVANINIAGTSGAGNTVTLKSSTATQPWIFNVSQLNPTVSYVTVSDSNASGGQPIIAYDGTNTDGTGNTNWLFTAILTDVSGTVYTNESKTTNIGAGKTIALSINGGAKVTAETDSNGAFSLLDNDISDTDVLALYIDDEAEKGSYIINAADFSGDITGLEFFTNRIELGHLGGTSITNSNLSTARTLADDDLLFTMSGANATFLDNYETWVATGSSYVPGGNITCDDIQISGTLTLGTNTLTISGSFDSSAGTISLASGNTIFDSGSSETITDGADSLGPTTFSGSGSWTLASSTSFTSVAISNGSINLGNDGIAITTGALNLSGGTLAVADQGIQRTKITATSYNNTGGELSLGNFVSFQINGNFVQSLGTTILGNTSLYITGDTNISGGTFTDSNNSKIYFSGSANGAITDIPALNASVYISKEDGFTLTFNDDLQTNGSFYISSGEINTNGRTLILAGSGSRIISGSSKTIGELSLTGGMLYADSGFTISDSLNISSGANLVLNGSTNIVFGNNASVTLAGTLSQQYTSSAYFVLEDDAVTNFPTTGTFTGKIRLHAKTKNISIPARTFYGRVEILNDSASDRTATLGTAAGQTITIGGHGFDNYYGSGLFPSASNDGNLTIQASTHNPNVLVTSYTGLSNGDFDFIGAGSGTEAIIAGSGTWSVKGNIDLTGGTLTAGTSTFVLNGASGQDQNITSAGQSFYNLTVTNLASTGVTFLDSIITSRNFTATTAGTKLRFTPSTTITIATLQLQGSSSSKVSLRSTTNGQVYNFNVTNTPTVSYVDVRDSNASGGAQINATNGTNTNSGNNTNWIFTGPAPSLTPTPTPTPSPQATATSEEATATPTTEESPTVGEAQKTSTSTAIPFLPKPSATSTAPADTIIVDEDGGSQTLEDGSTIAVASDQAVIQGVTIPNAIVYITISGKSNISEVVVADSEGRWSYKPTVPLDEGSYNLAIEIKNSQSGETISKKDVELKVLGASYTNQPKLIFRIAWPYLLALLILVLLVFSRRKNKRASAKR